MVETMKILDIIKTEKGYSIEIDESLIEQMVFGFGKVKSGDIEYQMFIKLIGAFYFFTKSKNLQKEFEIYIEKDTELLEFFRKGPHISK